MAYVSQSFRNDHTAPHGGKVLLAELRKLDTGIVNSGTGYAV
jgi:hypothetical protein